MPRALVIVESPAKAKTIGRFLGKNYTVKASMGHVVDLPRSQFGVDVKNDFKPKYITIRGKGKILQELRDAAKKADHVYLATDPDREGEAISWHLSQVLDLPSDANRIEFHEITQRAIQQALNNPRPLDIQKVNAQQARRILDRLVGYELSPLLWAKVRRGLSAGRVQSAAVRLICDREAETTAFIPEEYWTIDGVFLKGSRTSFIAPLAQVKGKKAEIPDEKTAQGIVDAVKKEKFTVADIKTKERSRYPAPPFTTSTLQQEAARKLGFSSRKTMMLAQQLYEGLELGEEGSVGLVTYIRTDSVHVAEEALQEAAKAIKEIYGSEYVPETSPVYKTKSTNAQEAHEAIRPTSSLRRPETVKAFLSRDQYRLYQLIWNRFVASQMRPALFDTMTVEIKGGVYLFRANGSTRKFAGFLALYQESVDEETQEEEKSLPELKIDEVLKIKDVDPKQHFTQPPPRYSEAMLIRALEELGIGRPSTYAPIIETILKRNYVTLTEKRFRPTELGQVVVDLLKEHFPEIVDLDFTAEMEEKLDQVEEGEEWKKVLREFYAHFSIELSKAKEGLDKVKIADEESDEVCELCGRKMIYKYGRFGKFLACPGYPECKNTKPIRKEINAACPLCGGKVVERRSKKGRRFYGCTNYPNCNFTRWDAPAKEPCPQCGSFCSVQKQKNEELVKCLKEGCDYSTVRAKEEEA